MKISKSLFKNLSRCDNFASIYDMYIFRNMHHIKTIYGEETKIYESTIDNLKEGVFAEQIDKAQEIFDKMFNEEDGEDLTIATSAQLEALMPYFTKLEIVAAEMIRHKFPGKLTYGDKLSLQKKYAYAEGEHEYYCYLDIYDECDDGTIKVFEVKGTTSKKFFELGTKVKEYVDREKENPLIRFPDQLKFDSIFTKDQDGIFRLKEELDLNILREVKQLLIDEEYKPDKEYLKYFEKRNKLFDRYSDVGKYVYDIAIERYIVENAILRSEDPNLINNMKFYLVVLNSDYTLEENLDLNTIDYPVDANGNELTICFDLTNITKEYMNIIENEKQYICDCIDRRTINKCCVGKHCEYKKTTECKFKNVCFSKVLHDGSVLEFIDRTFINSVTKEKYNIYDIIKEGYYKILDMPLELINKKKHIVQYDCMEKQIEYFDKEIIELAINEIKYPIYHLDFESFNCPFPRYFGEHPYQQSLFQFSIHVEKEKGLCDKTNNHLEYLAPDHDDHRRELCEKMIEYIDLSNGGTVLVYNEGFEKTRLKEMARIFPDLAEDLMKIHDAVFDLYFVLKGNRNLFSSIYPGDLTQKEKEERCSIFNYYNNSLHGSFSIKKVLPLFTNLSYKDLTVKNGTEAILTYSLLPTLTEEEYNRLYLALRKYCQQDTWAMVEILWGLYKKLNR